MHVRLSKWLSWKRNPDPCSPKPVSRPFSAALQTATPVPIGRDAESALEVSGFPFPHLGSGALTPAVLSHGFLRAQ